MQIAQLPICKTFLVADHSAESYVVQYGTTLDYFAPQDPRKFHSCEKAQSGQSGDRKGDPAGT
jgi:hypothetical protein